MASEEVSPLLPTDSGAGRRHSVSLPQRHLEWPTYIKDAFEALRTTTFTWDTFRRRCLPWLLHVLPDVPCVQLDESTLAGQLQLSRLSDDERSGMQGAPVVFPDAAVQALQLAVACVGVVHMWDALKNPGLQAELSAGTEQQQPPTSPPPRPHASREDVGTLTATSTPVARRAAPPCFSPPLAKKAIQDGRVADLKSLCQHLLTAADVHTLVTRTSDGMTEEAPLTWERLAAAEVNGGLSVSSSAAAGQQGVEGGGSQQPGSVTSSDLAFPEGLQLETTVRLPGSAGTEHAGPAVVPLTMIHSYYLSMLREGQTHKEVARSWCRRVREEMVLPPPPVLWQQLDGVPLRPSRVVLHVVRSIQLDSGEQTIPRLDSRTVHLATTFTGNTVEALLDHVLSSRSIRVWLTASGYQVRKGIEFWDRPHDSASRALTQEPSCEVSEPHSDASEPPSEPGSIASAASTPPRSVSGTGLAALYPEVRQVVFTDGDSMVLVDVHWRRSRKWGTWLWPTW